MRTRMVALAAAVATALGGCSMIGGGEDESGSSPSTSGVVNGDANENGAKTAGIDQENPPEPIGHVTLRSVSDDIDTTKVELLELRTEDNVMLATFRLTGDGRGNERTSAYNLLGGGSFAPVLVDMKNMEKYRNVDDLTSSVNDAEAPLGEPVYLFTAFPLPKDGVTSMDLRVTSEAPVIEDVPMPE